jgi:hypothetical protein
MTTQDYRPHTGPCCPCTPSLRGSVQGAIVSINVLKEMERDAEAMAAAEHANAVTLEAALKREQHKARRWEAAARAAVEHRNQLEAINAKQAQHIRALRAGEVVKS